MLHNPWFWALAGLVVFSGIVSGMPAPTEKDSRGYRWAYASLHTIAANFVPALRVLKTMLKLPDGPVDPRT